MKFEPTDYLSSLNIDFDSNINNDYFDDEVSPMIDNQQLQQDLDLFSQAANDFYSLDVLGDTTIPTKQQPQQQHQQQQQHQPQHQQQQPQQPQQPQQQLYNSSSTTTIVSPQFQTPIDYSQFQPQYEQNTQYAKPLTTHTPAPVYNNNNSSSIYGNNSIAAATSYSTVSTPAQAPGSTSTLVSSAEQASLLDKKKRNTAASARFRIKKKLKEQELHTKTKELEEKVERLQQKLRKMEVENKCLKTIIFKQNESKNSQLVESIKKRISEEYDLTGL
ncbi:hypothetical protein PVL30_005197 [Lodderomyces elongisporus]|uniref:uncharacterized protein n=1 Tax=Lodderomyces elongisporus TaxID=36914 RepID=UPI00291E35C3|nr:uncharacterized protein PVL30_005197 [Lodderomyces elongisporus]WLF81400.1 hypothetical protein PVL30_005197 [Lodderomyces elongisporus]